MWFSELYEYFVHCQSGDSHARYISPPPTLVMLITDPRMVIMIWAHSPILFLDTCIFGIHY